MKNINDYHVGSTVRVARGQFAFLALNAGLSHDTDYTISKVRPMGDNGGWVWVDGHRGTTRHDGGFGLLVFDVVDDAPIPVDKVMPTSTYDADTLHAVGDRVVVTDVRTSIAGHPVGSGMSSHVGATGSVKSVSGGRAYVIDFDDAWLSSRGTWSHEALESLSEDDADPSRKIEDLNHEVSDLRLAVDRHKESRQIQWQRAEDLAAERATLTQAASDERRRLCAEIDDLNARVGDKESEKLALVLEVEVLESTLDYALAMLDDVNRALVVGYKRGYTKAQTDA